MGDLYSRLKGFRKLLHGEEVPLFFAKVDVTAAFDTIPQTSVIEVMRRLPQQEVYRISKHFEIKPGEGYRNDGYSQAQSKPVRSWASIAKPSNTIETFFEDLNSKLAAGKKNTVFVENVVSKFWNRDELVALLSDHVKCNMVKIGKKFYRQEQGIPQGSIISSMLCNYFYADLEATHLSFLQSENSLLLRLIDDFLLITTDQNHAKRFLQEMHDGLPDYGVTVNPEKTLTNFEVLINGQKLARQVGNKLFPYCGAFIDTKTLNITKDRERRKDIGTLITPIESLADDVKR